MQYLNIFNGTVYPQAFHKPISTDIERLVQRYNTLVPRQFQSPQGNLVAISGYLAIPINNMPMNITLDITLVPRFPQDAPFVSLRMQPNEIRPSQAVAPTGVVNLMMIHQWVFKQSTLVKLVDDLYRYFLANPPLNSAPAGYPAPYGNQGYPQQGYPNRPPQNYGNPQQQQYPQQYPPQYQQHPQQYQQPQAYAQPQAAPAANPQEIEAKFAEDQKAYQKKLDKLRSQYHDHQMVFDSLIEETQKLARKHFTSSVSQKLKSYPQK
ncbi:MGC81040 protein, putative [Trichomonas vaginalis G3]|uniref:MGC81040 protein, putative n=1 Tax=Trichomonas vaginalis (strain ATCC PRA-98 / G3) TaxID=412133 RepID=A2E4C0_TRIV3|nr:tumor suppressor protein 101 family [Trichomonas vaginalis G3]EAY12455.1 MGC81040 protein, putative [Trichomonas vaginalis G3]KAI5539515.1 tumor suppressor protein 101 family [Trichomonas vaginalis G3]|eukprot:XP_001324678.1 MGC81040 protein [Trichomonas vaginalis G3]